MVRLQNEYQSEIPSICCDYFMEFPYSPVQLDERLKAQGMLMELTIMPRGWNSLY